jgi:hypothetical protein
MSAQDDINISDEEFDAFLKGEGELALMLRQLPQVQPPTQLDDAILAAAKVELATSTEVPAASVAQPVQQAANDPVIPGKAKSKSSFTSRWRIPLGLVASLFVTVQLVRMEIYDERMKPGAPALLVEKEPAPVEIAQPPASKPLVPPPVSVKIVPPPGYEPPQGISAPAAPVPATTEAIEAARATAAAASQPQEKRKISRAAALEERSTVAPKMALPSMAAAAPAPVVMPTPVPALIPAPVSDYAAKSARNEQQTSAAYGGIPDAAPAPSARAVAPVTAPESRSIVASQSAPALAAMPAPAPASDAASKMEQSTQRVEITGAIVRRSEPETTSSVQATASEDIRQSKNSVGDADAQLAKIDALFKSGTTPEALAAWRKFRRAYPDYKVPDELRTKIDALLNQQTLDSGR